jgi:hypothetical protein
MDFILNRKSINGGALRNGKFERRMEKEGWTRRMRKKNRKEEWKRRQTLF